MLPFSARPLRSAVLPLVCSLSLGAVAQLPPVQENQPGTTLQPLVPDVPGVHQQEPSPSSDSILTVNTRLVVLDVIVVDKNGHFVTGLDQSQFHVTEDKVPQTIRNFEAPAQHQMPKGSGGVMLVKSATDLPKIGNAPVNVLVLDEVNTAFNQIAYARQMMERYLKTQPEVLPVPTLFIAAGSKKIAVLHDYTQSRADLLASVKTHTTDTDFTTMIALLNGGRIGADNGMVQTLGALSQIATSVRGIPGRKNIIWVGKGYGNSNDLAHMSTADKDKAENVIRVVTDRMLASHMTLYMIDPEGTSGHLPYGPSNSADDVDQDAPGGGQGQGLEFEAFARNTGGNVITGRNDIETAMGEDVAEGSMYYTLTYRPSGASSAEKPYRRIRVTMTDPSLRVVAREGYYTEPEKVVAVADNSVKHQPKQLQFDLMSAARTTMAYTGLHMDAKTTRNGYTLLVRARDLTWTPQADGTRHAEVAVIAVAYDGRDKEAGQKAAKLTQEIGPNDVIQDGSVVGFNFPFALPPHTQRVRVVMRDSANGNMGSTNIKP